jgi:cell division septation protein DedD
MTQYFDDEEEPPEKSGRDTELTLGVGALVAIPLCLIALCAVCFGVGYSMGHRSPAPAVASATHTGPLDQEPLQGNGTIPKPSATAQAQVPPPEPPAKSAPEPAADNNQTAEPPPAAPLPAPPKPMPPANPAPAQSQVRSAIGTGAPQTGAVTPSSSVRTALPSGSAFMVQVAAVSTAEDANALANALRSRGYPVTEQHDYSDGLIHVRVGPFPTRDEASQWRVRLGNDGYNAVVQP